MKKNVYAKAVIQTTADAVFLGQGGNLIQAAGGNAAALNPFTQHLPTLSQVKASKFTLDATRSLGRRHKR